MWTAFDQRSEQLGLDKRTLVMRWAESHSKSPHAFCAWWIQVDCWLRMDVMHARCRVIANA